MLINCVICSDVFDPSSEVFATPCGHLFHYVCLVEWIERSKSCPQCRNKTTEKTIHRLYFNIQSNEGVEDVGTLQNKIDNLILKVQLKDSDIKSQKEQVETLSKQNKNLREEVRRLETKITSTEANIVLLKDQIKYLKVQLKNSEEVNEECRKLRSRLEMLNHVETVVQGTVTEVEDMLSSYNDSQDSNKAIATYASVLKRELQAASEKKKELREKLRKFQHEVTLLTQERNALSSELKTKLKAENNLDEDMKHLELENKSLRKKVKELEQAIISPCAAGPQASAIRRLIAESPAPKLTDPSTSVIEDTLASTPLTSKEKKMMHYRFFQDTRQNESSVSNPVTKTELSIFKKARVEISSSSLQNVEVYYDGLGGRAKIDEFPVPRKGGTLKNKFKLVFNGKPKKR